MKPKSPLSYIRITDPMKAGTSGRFPLRHRSSFVKNKILDAILKRNFTATAVVAFLCCQFPTMVLGAGATTSFTTLEAEEGVIAGGAMKSVIQSGSLIPELSTPEKEASGLGLVTLSAPGQSVSWTNPVADANGIVVRACIPDSASGGGITATLNLYVDGEFRQALTLSSKQSWNYGSSSTNLDDPNAGGKPFRFYNEDHVILTLPIAAGRRITLKKEASN
ncbi:MAG: hypothetical protein EOP04_33670, partial [Proteobacteria bacterium]